MAYTIIEVERATKIPSRKIRFWLDKGLFPFVERDENGVRYFAKSDMEWVKWIEWLRQCGMSLKEIREYAEALSGGIKPHQNAGFYCKKAMQIYKHISLHCKRFHKS